MTVMATEKRTAADLLRDYDGLAGHLLKLTQREESVIDNLRDALTTGDPKTLDAALRTVISAAQAARKSIKAGPPATATPDGIRVGDDVEIPWGPAELDGWRRATVTALSRDGSDVLVRRGYCSEWCAADKIRRLAQATTEETTNDEH